MKKFLLLIGATVVFILSLGSMRVEAVATNTPEATVKAFYTWYIKKQDARDAHYFQLMDNAIYSYVSKKTVDTLRDDYRHGRLPGDTDYFTRVQDLDPRVWLRTMIVHPSIMLDAVAVTPVTFGQKPQDRQNLVVFVVRENGHWRITKVEDTDNGYLGYHQYDSAE